MTSPCPSPRASATPCTGPAPPSDDQRELARVVAALDRHEPDLVGHARIDHAVDARRRGDRVQAERLAPTAATARSAAATSSGSARRRSAPGSDSRAGGWRRSPSPARRRGRSRPAPARRRRSAGPRAGRPRRRSTRCCRRRRRWCSRRPSASAPDTGRSSPRPAMSGLPPRTTATSLLVPPMSSETKSRTPERSAANLAPITPAAGPERKSVTGCCAARPAETMPAARAHHRAARRRCPGREGLGEAGQIALHHRAQIGVERGDAQCARTRGRSGRPRRRATR